MKHIGKVIPLLFLISVILMPYAVSADDGDLYVKMNVSTPGTANVGIGIEANEANLWINGKGLDELAGEAGYRAGSAAASAAVQASAPNSRYGEVSTGFLPPLSSNSLVAEVAPPGKYDNWVPGWQGYFCPHTNLDPMVYKGAGCGGKWGVCDGFPDFWARRQLAGLAPEFIAQKEKLNTVIEALAKVIVATEKLNGMVNGDKGISDLVKAQVAQLEDVRNDLCVLQQEHLVLAAMVEQQAHDFNRKLLIMSCLFTLALLCLAGAVLYLSSRRFRPRSWREL